MRPSSEALQARLRGTDSVSATPSAGDPPSAFRTADGARFDLALNHISRPTVPTAGTSGGRCHPLGPGATTPSNTTPPLTFGVGGGVPCGVGRESTRASASSTPCARPATKSRHGCSAGSRLTSHSLGEVSDQPRRPETPGDPLHPEGRPTGPRGSTSCRDRRSLGRSSRTSGLVRRCSRSSPTSSVTRAGPHPVALQAAPVTPPSLRGRPHTAALSCATP